MTPRRMLGPPGFNWYGIGANCTRIFMPYCDGSSFTGHRDGAWPVPNSTQRLTFRGAANFERTIDVLIRDCGLGEANDVVLSGGSAGGLSTYLKGAHHGYHFIDACGTASDGSTPCNMALGCAAPHIKSDDMAAADSIVAAWLDAVGGGRAAPVAVKLCPLLPAAKAFVAQPCNATGRWRQHDARRAVSPAATHRFLEDARGMGF